MGNTFLFPCHFQGADGQDYKCIHKNYAASEVEWEACTSDKYKYSGQSVVQKSIYMVWRALRVRIGSMETILLDPRVKNLVCPEIKIQNAPIKGFASLVERKKNHAIDCKEGKSCLSWRQTSTHLSGKLLCFSTIKTIVYILVSHCTEKYRRESRWCAKRLWEVWKSS